MDEGPSIPSILNGLAVAHGPLPQAHVPVQDLDFAVGFEQPQPIWLSDVWGGQWSPQAYSHNDSAQSGQSSTLYSQASDSGPPTRPSHSTSDSYLPIDNSPLTRAVDAAPSTSSHSQSSNATLQNTESESSVLGLSGENLQRDWLEKLAFFTGQIVATESEAQAPPPSWSSQPEIGVRDANRWSARGQEPAGAFEQRAGQAGRRGRGGGVGGRRHDKICLECFHVFDRVSNLKSHINAVHLGMRPYSCPDCGHGFARRRDVQRHCRLIHKLSAESSSPAAPTAHQPL